MAVPKVLLYYAFAPVADPEAVRLWQRDLCEGLNLRGRILISKHGINGTVGGDIDDVKMYLRKTKEYPGFKKMDAKWSDGTGLDDLLGEGAEICDRAGRALYFSRAPIPWWRNIPLLSWLLLRGKCADCHAPIPLRYWIVELLTALLRLSPRRWRACRRSAVAIR